MKTALEILSDKKLFPNDLTSAQIRRLAASMRNRAIFSAKTSSAPYLREMKKTLKELADGKINEATARKQLQDCLKELGYVPGKGTSGTIEDLSSTTRTRLIAQTAVRQARSVAQAMRGNTLDARRAYPAWRLGRIGERVQARLDWDERWQDAGDSVDWDGASRDCFIALKSSPIWEALGAGVGGYADTLQTGYPPFAFGSGMGWVAVERDDAEGLGLIDAETDAAEIRELSLTPTAQELNAAIKRDPSLGDDLDKMLKAFYGS